MKFLAFEKEIGNVDWKNHEKLLKTEALKVHELYLQGIIREIYFDECKNAILILETKTKYEAESLLKNLPLAKAQMVQFKIIELNPYSGFQRFLTD